MSYLEKVPGEYLCTYKGISTEVSCSPDDFCEDPNLISYTPDFSAEDSYHNWVEKFDLTCRSDAEIGLLGSATFAGWVITLTFVPRLSDIYGRKIVYRIGMVIQLLGFTILMFTSNFWVAVSALFLNGMCCTVRV